MAQARTSLEREHVLGLLGLGCALFSQAGTLSIFYGLDIIYVCIFLTGNTFNVLWPGYNLYLYVLYVWGTLHED